MPLSGHPCQRQFSCRLGGENRESLSAAYKRWQDAEDDVMDAAGLLIATALSEDLHAEQRQMDVVKVLQSDASRLFREYLKALAVQVNGLGAR